MLLLVVAAGYFGVNVAEVYYRYYRLQDAMKQQVRFARKNDDAFIIRSLRSSVDTLGLPSEAARIRVRRSDRTIVISTNYSEQVDMPLVTRVFHFAPVIRGPL